MPLLPDVKSSAMTDAADHRHHRVLVFDSGVGGLSVLGEIRRRLPCCSYAYACDNAGFPYGDKSETDLVARVDRVLKALIATIDPDIVVVACNTASTVALPQIRSHFRKPVVGVVPAIKPAAQLSRTGVIGLLATPGTVNRPYTHRLIADFAPHCLVIPVGSSELVHMAEAKLRNIGPDRGALRAIIAPLFADERTDTVVLACTHFPLLRDELEEAAPRPVAWVDSGEAIARRVASFTGDCPPGASSGDCGFQCWLTAANDALEAGLRRWGATSVTTFEVP